jgi:hypothetical protein
MDPKAPKVSKGSSFVLRSAARELTPAESPWWLSQGRSLVVFLSPGFAFLL